MQRMILNELSKDILAGKISKDDVVGMLWDEEAGAIRFFNVSKVEI
jgi:ATP-dependent Clp protease ATP-binding subunit ClpB